MRTEPRIGTKIYVKETGDAGEVKAHYFQYSIAGQRLHSVLVLLDNNEYGTYSPDELTKDIHALVTRVTDERSFQEQETPLEGSGHESGQPEECFNSGPPSGVFGTSPVNAVEDTGGTNP